MKKVILIVVTLFITQVTQAQKTKRADFTPEQQATLKTKKLALALDLDATQQKQMYELQLDLSKKRAERKKTKEDFKNKPLTAEEKYAKINQNLDRKLEVKKKFKQILSPQQYEKWEKMYANRVKKRKMKMHKKHL